MGYTLALQERDDEALEYFMESLEIDDQNPFTYQEIAKIYEKKGKTAEAEKFYTRAKDLDENIMGKHVIVVEDIVDSGNTLKTVLKMLGHRGPKSISLCTLLNKPSRREVEIDVQYVGFIIEDEFVLGYGLDYMQEYRNLPYVGVMGDLSELED